MPPALEARNTAAPAISWGSPMRLQRRGVPSSACRVSGSSHSARAKSVRIRPGAMQFTRTPLRTQLDPPDCAPSACRRPSRCNRPRSSGEPLSPPIELTIVIAPSPRVRPSRRRDHMEISQWLDRMLLSMILRNWSSLIPLAGAVIGVRRGVADKRGHLAERLSRRHRPGAAARPSTRYSRRQRSRCRAPNRFALSAAATGLARVLLAARDHDLCAPCTAIASAIARPIPRERSGDHARPDRSCRKWLMQILLSPSGERPGEGTVRPACCFRFVQEDNPLL
jgi:hypothetical protein